MTSTVQSQNSNMSLDQDEEKKQYDIYLYDGKEPLYNINDITLYQNLSGYISVFVNDIKDQKIILPDFVKEREMNLIIEFIEAYSKTMNYKLNMLENKYKINIEKPVRDISTFKKEVGDCYEVIEKIFSQKLFLSVINTAMCLDITILFDIICAKIALDIKYMTRSEMNDYFNEAKSK